MQNKKTRRAGMISAKTKKKEVLKLAELCRKCGHCCSLGSGFVLDEEIPGLARALDMPEKEFIKKFLEPGQRFNTRMFRFRTKRVKKGREDGPCVFLKGSKCSIHDMKPLYCRIGNCNEHGPALMQWFNVNHFLNSNDPVSIREYAIYCEMNELIEGAHVKEIVPEKKLMKVMDYYELKRKPTL